jgi:hypothetical protein
MGYRHNVYKKEAKNDGTESSSLNYIQSINETKRFVRKYSLSGGFFLL